MGVGQVVARGLAAAQTLEELLQLVKVRCVIDEASKCWVWKDAKSDGGYAVANIRQKMWRVTRYILFVKSGELHEAALHSCDNPPCCNPAHLRWGTKHENTLDAKGKGRLAVGEDNGARRLIHRVKRGSDQGAAKLTEGQVLEIRRQAALGESHAVLARLYGVSKGNIGQIWRRETWRHV